MTATEGFFAEGGKLTRTMRLRQDPQPALACPTWCEGAHDTDEPGVTHHTGPTARLRTDDRILDACASLYLNPARGEAHGHVRFGDQAAAPAAARAWALAVLDAASHVDGEPHPVGDAFMAGFRSGLEIGGCEASLPTSRIVRDVDYLGGHGTTQPVE